MAGLQLELPTIQNWSCHNCSGCCRQHAIEVTEEERQRILDQNWSEADGIPKGQPVVVPISRLPWSKGHRLAHQSDGACVFLDEKGLCRIHARHGEAAKPLACRVYPYAFHPHGKKVTVSLRFSCPSVVQNLGQAVSDQTREIGEIAHAVVPGGVTGFAPPRVSKDSQVGWPDFDRFIRQLDSTIADPDQPIVVKLQRALFWIGLVEQSGFDTVKGAKLEEFLELVSQSAGDEVSTDTKDVEKPSRTGSVQFRMLVAQYARKDTFSEKNSGWKNRWKLLRAATRFAGGIGNVPPLQEMFRKVPFGKLEQSFGSIPNEAEEIFTRYFRVKIQGLHFCGPAYYDVPLVEGFWSLALVYPATLWIARWLAVSEERSSLQVDDIVRAITIVDHHHGYSPLFGSNNFRRRVRMLARLGDIEKLCAWYSR